MSVTTLHAAKRAEDPMYLLSCLPDDPAAIQFSISYPGMPYSCSTVDLDSRYAAENVQRALERVFEAGKRAAKQELRSWIGS